MGNICHRRRNMTDTIEENEWIVIQHTESNLRFKRVVKKIMNILIMRKIYARAGSYLNTSTSRKPENAHIRKTMSDIFSQWPRTALKGTKVIFNHVKRERGQLVYR